MELVFNVVRQTPGNKENDFACIVRINTQEGVPSFGNNTFLGLLWLQHFHVHDD